MNKLDEIQERIGRTMSGITFPHTLGQDTQLLIRGVRQLGTVYAAMYREDKSIAEFVDPDVLDLIAVED
jgi:hypothetical protein